MNSEYNSRLKTKDTCFVLINLLIFRIFSRFPAIFFTTSGSGAALTALWSGLISFAAIFLFFWLWGRLGGGNIINLANMAFGSFGKYTAITIVEFCLFLSAVSALSDISALAKIISFPTAPFWFVVLFFVLGALLGTLSGLDSLFRTHGIFVPLIVFGLALLIISVVSSGDFNRLFPILGSGPQAVFGKGLSGTIMHSDILLLFLLSPSESHDKFPRKKFLIASGVGIALCTLFVFAVSVSVSEAVITEESFSFYLCLKEIYYGRFFQRIDAIMQLLSSLSVMLYLSLSATLFSAKVLGAKNLRKQKVISSAFILIVAAACLILRTIGQEVFRSLLFIFGFSGIGLLLVTLLFAKRRNKNEKI